MAKKKKEEKEEKPEVHQDLDGFDVSVDSFGEVKANYDIDKINEFLDKEVEDKKLKHKPKRKKNESDED